jgi:hypothetical protein
MSSSTTGISWLTRLVLGKRAEEGEAAKRDFRRALTRHRFDPDEIRTQLDHILEDAEQKARALSLPPRAAPKEPIDDERSEHEPGNRASQA